MLSTFARSRLRCVGTAVGTPPRPAATPTRGCCNAFGVRLLPKATRDALFRSPERRMDDAKMKAALAELKKFSLGPGKSSSSSDAIKLTPKLPLLYGDVESHFEKIGSDQAEPYLKLLSEILNANRAPPMPSQWSNTAGWTMYKSDGSMTPVAAPLEHCYSFDVEVCVSEGAHPLMATAVSGKAWYSWTSPHLIRKSRPESSLSALDLIPLMSQSESQSLASSAKRLIIGHNVCYDRARCAEEYNLVKSGTRFLDTMSLHIIVNGMTSGQRLMKQAKKGIDEDVTDNDNPGTNPKWMRETSLNNLADVFHLYCPDQPPISKEKRDVFVTGTIDDVAADFQSLMSYCASDSLATFDLIRALFPLFQSRCPHPVTFAAMLEMGTAVLPVSDRWEQYIHEAEDISAEMEEEVERVLGQQAKEACQLGAGERFKEDLWMWDQDWSVAGLKYKATKAPTAKKRKKKDVIPEETPLPPSSSRLDQLKSQFKDLLATSTNLYKVQPALPNYPAWYRSLCVKDTHASWSPYVSGLTPSKMIAPKLLRLSWMGFPLHRHEKEKWGYFVPRPESSDEIISNSADFTEDSVGAVFPSHKLHKLSSESEQQSSEAPDWDEAMSSAAATAAFEAKAPSDADVMSLPEAPGCHFVKLPHKDGKAFRVGNPLAKDFMDKVKGGILFSHCGVLANKVLQAGNAVSYWRSNRDRIMSQMVVSTADGSHRLILPQLVTAGTLTRRAVERTWLTASNAKKDRIGSELKTLVEAPPGHCLVGADVDSQELWIASVLGDAQFAGDHGCTPLGWMTLQGNKADATDLHSVTAKTVGVSRDHAKVLNYGRIYGAGLSFAKLLLQRFNPKLTEAEAKKLAVIMYEKTKGEKRYQLNRLGAECYGALLFAKGILSDPTKIDSLKSVAVTRIEMAQIVRTKRKMDMLVRPCDDNKNLWSLTEEGEALLLMMGLEADRLTAMDRRQLYEAMRALGNVRQASAADAAKAWPEMVAQVRSRSVWHGGAESHTFNRLEAIALDWQPKTPVLQCKISRVLESEMVGSDFIPSRVNWVVQSSAVDYLHLLLVAMNWLMSDFGIGGRFVISIHDEVRYLVPTEDRYRAALALQLANLLVRAMFCSRLGMTNLPECVAYFSGVDVDTVMRKDPLAECVTPSNPHGLTHGHGIAKGEVLTVEQIVEKAGPELIRRSAAAAVTEPAPVKDGAMRAAAGS